MPFWIEGWIEATRTDGPEQDEHSWSGVVQIGPLVDVADDVSEQLFGLSKRLVGSPEASRALAANRGIPPNPSAEVQAVVEEHAAHEAEHGPGEVGGYTYAMWSELSSMRAALPALSNSDWALVFDLADRLAADPRLSPHRLRVVVWFNW